MSASFSLPTGAASLTLNGVVGPDADPVEHDGCVEGHRLALEAKPLDLPRAPLNRVAA